MQVERGVGSDLDNGSRVVDGANGVALPVPDVEIGRVEALGVEPEEVAGKERDELVSAVERRMQREQRKTAGSHAQVLTSSVSDER